MPKRSFAIISGCSENEIEKVFLKGCVPKDISRDCRMLTTNLGKLSSVLGGMNGHICTLGGKKDERLRPQLA